MVGVVSASGEHDTRVIAIGREQHLRPELTITCYTTFPQDGAGCRVAVLGTNAPDTLTGGDAGEIVIGFGGADRMRGEGGHDCLVGGPGPDRLTGGDGDDRVVGGRGRDRAYVDRGDRVRGCELSLVGVGR